MQEYKDHNIFTTCTSGSYNLPQYFCVLFTSVYYSPQIEPVDSLLRQMLLDLVCSLTLDGFHL